MPRGPRDITQILMWTEMTLSQLKDMTRKVRTIQKLAADIDARTPSLDPTVKRARRKRLARTAARG